MNRLVKSFTLMLRRGGVDTERAPRDFVYPVPKVSFDKILNVVFCIDENPFLDITKPSFLVRHFDDL